MGKHRWYGPCALGVLLNVLVGCSMQASYMRGWEPVAKVNHRWTGGTLKEPKLSDDEAVVFKELGEPDTIRFFRATQTRQRVYEWLYEEEERAVWFVDGKRVEYVAVDTNSSKISKEKRDTLRRKMVAGGALGAFVGGFAAGVALFGDTLGLKE